MQYLLNLLESRFKSHESRHRELRWEEVLMRLQKNVNVFHSLIAMESTGGEPDVVGIDEETREIIFMDCSPESPSGRRSLCYDPQALESRKQNKPLGSAIGMAREMGVNILSEHEYQTLQNLGEFDLKTSSWIFSPKEIRSQGGAIFGDRRFGRVFTYHNGAESYYASRGFRSSLRV